MFVGLLVGIFALIPGVQIVGAALMCVPFRGNVPLAAGATLLSNPATTPMILLAAIAARTRRLRLGTNALVAAFRDPVVLAKQIAALQVPGEPCTRGGLRIRA